MPMMPLPAVAHLLHHADNGVGVRVHVSADGIDANEMDFDPRRFCGGAKGFDAVAGAAVGANDAFFLGLGEDVHHAFIAIGPIAFGEAMHEADVDVIGAEFAAEAIEIVAGGGGVASPGLGKNGNFVARDVFEGFGDMRMAAVGIGGVEKRRPWS